MMVVFLRVYRPRRFLFPGHILGRPQHPMILFRGGLTLSLSLSLYFSLCLALSGSTFVVCASGGLVGICCWLFASLFPLSIAKKGVCVLTWGWNEVGEPPRLVKWDHLLG